MPDFEIVRPQIELVRFTPDCKNVIIQLSCGAVLLYTIDGLSSTVFLKASKKICLSFNSDCSKLLAITEEGTIALVSIDGSLLNILRDDGSKFCSAEFNATGDRIRTMSRDATARVWDLNGAFLISMVHEKAYKLHAEEASDQNPFACYNGNQIATILRKGVKLWSLDGTLSSELSSDSDKSTLTSCTFHNNRIISIFADLTIKPSEPRRSVVKLWTSLGNLVTTLPANNLVDRGLLFNENENIIITLSEGDVRLLKIPSINLSLIHCFELLQILKYHKSAFRRSCPGNK